MLDQEILSTLKIILYRLNEIDKKLNHLNDPYNLKIRR